MIKIIEPEFETLPEELRQIREESEIYTDKKVVYDKVKTLMEKYPFYDICISELNFAMSKSELRESKCYDCVHMKKWKFPFFTCKNDRINNRVKVDYMNSKICLYFDMK